jgi:beta-galactosidase/beta-glucuronidase
MTRSPGIFFLLLTHVICAAVAATGQERPAASLPEGVKAVWDAAKAHRETTATRERLSINGLWRWQPAQDQAAEVPAGNWGHFKVPGCWPGVTDYMQKDCQTVFPHPSWKNEGLAAVTAAWYQREISVPKEWAGRRITLGLEYVNSSAVVYVDGKKIGEIQFPAGEVDLTAACPAGGKHLLSLLVAAKPLQEIMLMFNDTNAAKRAKSKVARRGLCGDLYLAGVPAGPRVGDVKVTTSVRKGEITLSAAFEGLAPTAQYVLRAVITDHGQKVKELASQAIKAGDLKEGRVTLTEKWKPEKLWDVHTPQNTYEVTVSLLSGDKLLDVAHPVRFGFREFWIDGRDFYLNGTRIFLCALPVDNAQVSALAASYEGAGESLSRLKAIGINFVYTHNYGCEPGTHLGFEGILRAADDVGMLVALSQPHFAQYDWQSPDAPEKNGYAHHARFYVRVAGSHPSVVFYSMSHNSTGYDEDMNPDLIDGIHSVRGKWSDNNVKRALQAEAIVARLDPERIVYHHSSGNLSSMHTSNFYTNMAPIQELDDWFEHWATKGVKPMFTCEYMVPCTWDWTMYRGWYKGVRTFGSAVVPWEFCNAEWSAQFLGDRAYQVGEEEEKNLRWEAAQFRAGKLWHRWDYPHQVGSRVFQAQHEIIGKYLASNWRAFRTWGVSAMSPWEYHFSWSLRPGVDKGRKELPVDWENLQRPGFSPDYRGQQYECLDLGYDRSDWVPTADGEALLRNNKPLLAYIAGKPAAFTSKDHNFYPGETIEKQIILINNSRQSVTCDCDWSLALPQAEVGIQRLTIATGQQGRVPLQFKLPDTLTPGTYNLNASVEFSSGETQKDSFAIQVLPQPAAPRAAARIAVFDPKGETTKLLAAMGTQSQQVEAGADLAGYDVLVIGKKALTADGPGPDLGRVRDGLKVIVFEQTSEVLERRLGFRVTEYGLRHVFKRVPDHPLLAGLDVENLCDWRGEATLLPPRLKYSTSRTFGGPAVKWCGIEVPHVWRCGNRGNVASVLIEKPARGDFLPIVDGGYALQYSPLMEYREGKGMAIFCQLDVTGRTEQDPAAETLTRNLIQYVSTWKPAPRRHAVYAGDPAGQRHLESSGIPVRTYEGGEFSAEDVLIVGTGGGRKLAANAAAVSAFVNAGGNVLALGLDEAEANAILPQKVSMKKAEHIAAFFDPPHVDSWLAGVCPADVHNRAPLLLPLVTAGAQAVGNGVLAKADKGNVVFCQFPPYLMGQERQNERRTFRRTSYLLARLLANMGVAAPTPVLVRFSKPVDAAKPEQRWLDGLYLDRPEEWDDPYRFFRW